MATSDFTAEDWIERLAQALTELAKTQGWYRAELNQIERELSQGSGFDHPSDVLREFYSLACVGKSRYHAGEYGSLCAALAEARSVLAAHPALAKVRGVPAVHPARVDLVEPPEPRDDIWIQILSHGYRGSLSSMIARLMVHRREGPDGGLRRAVAELDRLLAPRGNLDQSPLPDDLSVGYHVALFHGLRVGEQVPLADDMAILPFEQWGTFVNARILQDFAPAILRDTLRGSVGALVQPFRWKPAFRRRGGGPSPRLDGGRSFFRGGAGFCRTAGAVPHRAGHLSGNDPELPPSHGLVSPGRVAS